MKLRVSQIALCIVLLLTTSGGMFGQTKTAEDVVDAATALTDQQRGKLITALNSKIDSLKTNPEFYNKLWNFLVGRLGKDNEDVKQWLNDLKIDFKTFQNEDSTKSSLGFSYEFKVERGRIKDDGAIRNGWSGGLDLNGNVAFRKEVNPYNFLSSKATLTYMRTGGGFFGQADQDNKEFFSHLSDLRQSLTKFKTYEEIINSKEWQELDAALMMKASWILLPTLSAGLESNQDFSKTQFAAGLRIGATVKAWDNNSRLSKLNVLDWPFALIRRLSGFDKKGIHPLGAALPTVSIGLDYVDPAKDTVREKIESKLSPYMRANMELSFRTIVAKAFSQTIYFNSSLRSFSELGASEQIKTNHLASFNYFTTSLSSSSGFYVAYTKGKLPFDRASQGVYQLGFTYNFQSKDK